MSPRGECGLPVMSYFLLSIGLQVRALVGMGSFFLCQLRIARILLIFINCDAGVTTPQSSGTLKLEQFAGIRRTREKYFLAPMTAEIVRSLVTQTGPQPSYREMEGFEKRPTGHFSNLWLPTNTLGLKIGPSGLKT